MSLKANGLPAPQPANAAPYGCCKVCGAALHKTHYALAWQFHAISYTRPGDTPEEQAVLNLDSTAVRARFCSKACFHQGLRPALEADGLPAGLAEHRVLGGPIHPCVKCGKPVNLMASHPAWVRCKQTMIPQDDEEISLPDWFDVMGVECADCDFSLASERQNRGAVDQKARAPV